MQVSDRLVGLVERIEIVDALYGITKEEREVLDAIRGVHGLVREDLANEES